MTQREKHEWKSIKVWAETYTRLKTIASLRNQTLSDMLDEWSAEAMAYELKEAFGGPEAILAAGADALMDEDFAGDGTPM